MSDHDQASSKRGSVLGHLGSMLAVALVMGVIVAGLAIPFAGVVGVASRNFADSMDQLPDELETQALPQRTRILAADGSQIATIYDENRVNVPLRQVSKRMRQAILAIEDYRFYEHGALDLKGTLRAFITNQASGRTVQGGSSITQQMVKLTLIQQAGKDEEKLRKAKEDTFARKLRELRYAIAFEQNYSKDWILERYLNIAYFGDGVHGIQSAAKHYFSKDARKLNLREAATLAGLVKNPTGYDPTNHPDRALTRRNTVLDRMADLNVIPEKRAEKVKKTSLGLRITPNRNGCLFSSAPFFCQYVTSYLERDPALGRTKEQRRNLLKTGGLTIKTTLDPRFQEATRKSVRGHVFPREQAIGAMALVQPGSGDVKALAQSRPMGNNKKQGQTFINYTTPKEYGGSRGFQAGSTFKAFVLAQAVRQGISLSTAINSPETRTFQEQDYQDCDGDPYGYGSFSISNSTDSGTMTLYTGTRLSVNTFYMALEQKTGICKPYRLAKQMGVQLTNPTGKEAGSAERVPTFTLGVTDTTPLELSEAYATFAARGLHCDSRPVTEIRDSNNNLIKKYPKKCTQVLPNSVADAVNDVLEGVTAPGGFGQYIAPDQPSAGKTGTTSSQNSVWFVGYTPNLAGAAMLAGADENGSPSTLVGKSVGGVVLGSASGSGTAGPIWGDTFKAVEQYLPNKDFVEPDGSTIAGVQVPVPSVSGKTVDEANSILGNANFSVTNGGNVYSSVPAGLVAYSYPGSGSMAPSGSQITIYVSAGPKPAPPPKKKNKGGNKKKKKKKNGGGNNKPGRGRG